MTDVKASVEFGDKRLPDRFWKRVSQATGGCWLWTGTLTEHGYGHVMAKWAPSRKVHRTAYLMLVGPIPAGLCIDHLCRVRSCVNPAHLEAVTNRENVIRGVGPTALNAAKTHCVNGHAFTDANIIPVLPAGRVCRECRRIASRDYWRRRRRLAKEQAEREAALK